MIIPISDRNAKSEYAQPERRPKRGEGISILPNGPNFLTCVSNLVTTPTLCASSAARVRGLLVRGGRDDDVLTDSRIHLHSSSLQHLFHVRQALARLSVFLAKWFRLVACFQHRKSNRYIPFEFSCQRGDLLLCFFGEMIHYQSDINLLWLVVFFWGSGAILAEGVQLSSFSQLADV